MAHHHGRQARHQDAEAQPRDVRGELELLEDAALCPTATLKSLFLEHIQFAPLNLTICARTDAPHPDALPPSTSRGLQHCRYCSFCEVFSWAFGDHSMRIVAARRRDGRVARAQPRPAGGSAKVWPPLSVAERKPSRAAARKVRARSSTGVSVPPHGSRGRSTQGRGAPSRCLGPE